MHRNGPCNHSIFHSIFRSMFRSIPHSVFYTLPFSCLFFGGTRTGSAGRPCLFPESTGGLCSCCPPPPPPTHPPLPYLGGGAGRKKLSLTLLGEGGSHCLHLVHVLLGLLGKVWTEELRRGIFKVLHNGHQCLIAVFCHLLSPEV